MKKFDKPNCQLVIGHHLKREQQKNKFYIISIINFFYWQQIF